MARRLEGRVALVTGGSRGIGRAIASRLASEGAQVWLTGRDRAVAEALAADLAKAFGTVVRGVGCEFGDPAAPAGLVREIAAASKALHILVHSAGVMAEGRIGMISAESSDAQWSINARSALLLVQAASRLMQRTGGGSIVLLGSIVGDVGLAGYAAYSMSKAAIAGLTRSAAHELGPAGIRVNAISPGIIDTDLVAHLSDAQRAERVTQTALRRLGTTEDVAGVAAFLASDDARFITGQVVRVDGGLRL